MTRRPTIAALGLLGAAAIAGAVWLSQRPDDTASFDPAQFRSPTGPVPAAAQRPGDPEAGRRALLNAPYVSCGIPYGAYSRLAPETDPDELIPEREGRNAELPYRLTSHVNADGVEIVANNCLTCHAESIGGETVIGLGNAFGDFTTDPNRLVLQVGNYVSGAAETRAWQHWADRIEGIAPYTRTRTVGANPAPNLTWALMSHLDPETLEWSKTPLIDPPPEDPLPISVPPWWGMRKKNAMFYTSVGRGDHARFMLLASMLCVGSPEEVAEIDSYAPDIRAYIASLEAPAYPYPIDTALAARGETVYRDACAACHGSYGDEESFPNLTFAADRIGTDPAYANAATDGSRDRFFAWLVRSPYGDIHSAAPVAGYIAPPLDGVWATAPYLHNGSVPSLAALLDSGSRPKYWRLRTDPRRYDPEALGWDYDPLDHGQDAETAPDARRRIYDTTLPGYGNGGHTYSDRLDDAARAALLEYLKTL